MIVDTVGCKLIATKIFLVLGGTSLRHVDEKALIIHLQSLYMCERPRDEATGVPSLFSVPRPRCTVSNCFVYHEFYVEYPGYKVSYKHDMNWQGVGGHPGVR